MAPLCEWCTTKHIQRIRPVRVCFSGKKNRPVFEIEGYEEQKPKWPTEGRHILAQYTEDAVLVYQAFTPPIVSYAVEHGHFGGPHYLPKRMTWIKTNFLWMMFRSGWGTKPNQEATIGLWIKRSAFEDILLKAVHSSYVEEVYGTREEYDKLRKEQQKNKNKGPKKQKNVEEEEEEEEGEGGDSGDFVVRLQWDPDHTPSGGKHASRRAIQLGLRGWSGFVSGDDIVAVENLTDFVAEQRENVTNLPNLKTPKERVYQVLNQDLKKKLGLGEWQE